MQEVSRLSPTRFTTLDDTHVARGRSWDDLKSINDAQVNLAILSRPNLELPLVASELFQANFDHFQVVMSKDEDPFLLGALLDDELDLASPDAADLYFDMIGILREFFRISSAQEIGVRLEAVATDMCSLFHCDMLPLRLVCTYEGPGTEWLFNKDANRDGLLKGDNGLVLRPDAIVQRVKAGEIGIMKGEKFKAPGTKALIHRSPSIKGTGIRRLFLRMDVLK